MMKYEYYKGNMFINMGCLYRRVPGDKNIQICNTKKFDGPAVGIYNRELNTRLGSGTEQWINWGIITDYTIDRDLIPISEEDVMLELL